MYLNKYRINTAKKTDMYIVNHFRLFCNFLTALYKDKTKISFTCIKNVVDF